MTTLSVYDVLTGRATLAQVRQDLDEHLFAGPGPSEPGRRRNGIGRRSRTRSDPARSIASDREPFDFLVFDCPPSLGVLTLNALTTVREVFLPLQPHFLALHGLSKLLQTIELVAARLNPQLRLSGVVMCMYESATRLAGEVCGDVEEFFGSQSHGSNSWSGAQVLQTKIRRNIRLAEAPSFGQSIFQYAPKSHGAEDYQALAQEVLAQEVPSAELRAAEAAA